jgi:hypothetical protein
LGEYKQNPEEDKFAKVLMVPAGYAVMSDAELGLNTLSSLMATIGILHTEIAWNEAGGIFLFKNILGEFAPKFENIKLLARKLRSTLSPIAKGEFFMGTFPTIIEFTIQ